MRWTWKTLANTRAWPQTDLARVPRSANSTFKVFAYFLFFGRRHILNCSVAHKKVERFISTPYTVFFAYGLKDIAAYNKHRPYN